MQKMTSNRSKLKERVKELNCLYELSRIAWEATNDIDVIISKTLEILPNAMQHPSLAEARISVENENHSTPGFDRAKDVVEEKLASGKKSFGTIEVGYRRPGRKSKNSRILPEEIRLLKTIARELSLVIHKSLVEDEKQKLQLQLQHADRLAFVGELSAGIAHELNEPLGRVLGFAQLIKKSGKLGEQEGEDLERIIKASLYSREIIKKLMLFSRQMPQQITKVNLNKIVSDILYFIDLRFQSRSVRITKNMEPSLPEIWADEVQIGQVLVNLITNAVNAMPEGGDITVATKRKAGFVSLMVKDTGVGMSAETKSRIFQPFFTTRPVGMGTGLGLSVLKGIVDSHHGTIKVSTAVGAGSKFEIILPVRQQTKRHEKDARP
jgi:two-component system NtrC family sensor kinase